MKVLLVEDEKDMQKIIRLYLEKDGWQVSVAKDGIDALTHLVHNHFDVVIMDWMMPNMDGVTLCREMKKLHIDTKIMMLTAKSTVEDELKGLQCGVDDFLRKPFDPRVLLLRVKKLVLFDKLLVNRDIQVNLQTQTVTKGNDSLQLSKKEYQLLCFFMMNRGMILSRERILDSIWGMDYDGDDRTIDTHIRRLRSKIGDNQITTHIGLGYSMEK